MPRGRILSPDEREKVIRLAATGLDFKAVAAECGVSKSTAQRIAAKAGQQRYAPHKTTIARNVRMIAGPRKHGAKRRRSYGVLVDEYLAAIEAERRAVNGDRAAARLRVRAALDAVLGRTSP